MGVSDESSLVFVLNVAGKGYVVRKVGFVQSDDLLFRVPASQ